MFNELMEGSAVDVAFLPTALWKRKDKLNLAKFALSPSATVSFSLCSFQLFVNFCQMEFAA